MAEQTPRLVCERCQTADAVVHLTRFEDGRGAVHHYCVDCARAIGAAVTIATTSQQPARPPE